MRCCKCRSGIHLLLGRLRPGRDYPAGFVRGRPVQSSVLHAGQPNSTDFVSCSRSSATPTATPATGFPTPTAPAAKRTAPARGDAAQCTAAAAGTAYRATPTAVLLGARATGYARKSNRQLLARPRNACRRRNLYSNTLANHHLFLPRSLGLGRGNPRRSNFMVTT